MTAYKQKKIFMRVEGCDSEGPHEGTKRASNVPICQLEHDQHETTALA
jgi:hypothetical protein